MSYDVVIKGAGPAGLSAAIELCSRGWKVLLLEQALIPRKKVCGGFVGPENRTFFKDHGLLSALYDAGAHPIDDARFSVTGHQDYLSLPFGGGQALGISRHKLDQMLWDYAKQIGVDVQDGMRVVESCPSQDGCGYEVTVFDTRLRSHAKVEVSHMINASGGTRGSLENQKHLFGISAMFSGVQNIDGHVYLHFADQGHVGVNHFEDGLTNVCYVVNQKKFYQHQGNMQGLYDSMCQDNALLQEQMHNARRENAWKAVYILEKAPRVFYNEGWFNVGDSVAMINPVIGGGISMAIYGGWLLGSLLGANHPQKLTEDEVAVSYKKQWNKAYGMKIRVSPYLGKALHKPVLANALFSVMKRQQYALSTLFNWTHRERAYV